MTSGLILGKKTYSKKNISKLCSFYRKFSLCHICLRESCTIMFIWTVVRDWPSIFHWPSTYSVILPPLGYPFDFTRNNKTCPGGKWIHVYIWLSPCLFTWNCNNIVNRLNPIQSKKFKNSNNNNNNNNDLVMELRWKL